MNPLDVLHLQSRLEGKEIVHGNFLRQVEEEFFGGTYHQKQYVILPKAVSPRLARGPNGVEGLRVTFPVCP